MLHDLEGGELTSSRLGGRMQITVQPSMDPRRELDLTHDLVSAIAGALWRHHGGNEQLNWLEAEQHLRRIALGEWAGPRAALPRTGERGRPLVDA